MEVQYIIAIAAGGLFGLLFIIGICMYIYNNSKQRKLFSKISAMYNDNNLERIDYDFGYDNDTARIISTSRTDGQVTIEDVLIEAAISPVDEMEEITGSYKPD